MTSLFPVGINSWFNYEKPFSEQIKLIKEAGFTHTALWWTDERPDREEHPAIARDHGITVESSHIEYMCASEIWSESESVRNTVVDLYLTRIKECARHKIPVIVMHVCHKDGKPGPHQQGIDCFRTVMKAAEDYGVQVALENTSNTKILDYVFHELQSPVMKYCYDSSHDWLYSANKGALLEQYGSMLAVTHFSDNDGKEDRHWTPGKGIVDWKVVAQHFPVKTYSGTLSLEIGYWNVSDIMTQEEFLRDAYAQITNIRDLVVAEYESRK